MSTKAPAVSPDRATVALKLLTVLGMCDLLVNFERRDTLLEVQRSITDVMGIGDVAYADTLADQALVLGFRLLKREGHPLTAATDALIEERTRALMVAAEARSKGDANAPPSPFNPPRINVKADTNQN